VVRLITAVIVITVLFCWIGLNARNAPAGAIDTILVRSMDVTRDGAPDSVSLHLIAKGIDSPFSWVLTICSGGNVLYRQTGNDSAIDILFHDAGYVPGCGDYSECKIKYYFHDLLSRLEVPYSLEGVLDRRQSNTLYPIGQAYLDTCCGVRGAAADTILSSMERRLRSGASVVISIPTSPQTRERPMVFVPEVNRFVPIYEE
jgi:hypothetical protein